MNRLSNLSGWPFRSFVRKRRPTNGEMIREGSETNPRFRVLHTTLTRFMPGYAFLSGGLHHVHPRVYGSTWSMRVFLGLRRTLGACDAVLVVL